MKYLILISLIGVTVFSQISFGATTYTIEAEVNDETFVINGEVFKAKLYCFGFNKGDRVIFLDGSAYGIYVSATIYNKSSNETCDLWCE